MLEISKVFHFLFCGIYALLVVIYFQVRQKEKSPSNSHYLWLCILSFCYCVSIPLVSYGPFSFRFSVSLVLMAACLGFGSLTLFSLIMDNILKPTLFTKLARALVGLVLFCFSLSLLQVLIFSESWTVVASDIGYKNAFFERLLSGYDISPMAKVLLGIGSVVTFATLSYYLVKLLKSKNRDNVLTAGVALTLVVTLNDQLAGLNVNSYMFPLAGIGYLVEILRFQHSLFLRGHVAGRNLKTTLDRLSVVSVQNQMGSLVRHDLKHLISDLISDESVEDSTKQKLFSMSRFFNQKDLGRRNISINLSEIVEWSYALVKDEGRRLGVSFSNQCESKIIVECDPVDLTLAFYNLFKNSVEAFSSGSEGNRKILVRSEEDPSTISVHVTDSAGGIDDQTRAKIFHVPFSTKEGGSGFGLVSVKESLLANHALIVNLPMEGSAWFKISFLKSSNRISKT